MTARRCARCDSTNVDDEGYCWTCEYQHPCEAQETVTAEAAAPKRRGRVGGRRSDPVRLLVMTVAPITTLVLIGCVVGAVAIFERADAVVGAGAPLPDASRSGAPPDAGGDPAACVVGIWRLVATDATFSLSGGSFHGTGAGGTLTFDADGTGSFDYAGWSVSGIMNGATVTATATGVETFRYRLDGARLRYEQVSGSATAVVQSRGTALGETVARTATRSENLVGCAGKVLTATGASGGAGQGDGEFGSFNETYTRLS